MPDGVNSLSQSKGWSGEQRAVVLGGLHVAFGDLGNFVSTDVFESFASDSSDVPSCVFIEDKSESLSLKVHFFPLFADGF